MWYAPHMNNNIVRFRASPMQIAQLKSWAAQEHLDLSSYIRKRLFAPRAVQEKRSYSPDFKR